MQTTELLRGDLAPQIGTSNAAGIAEVTFEAVPAGQRWTLLRLVVWAQETTTTGDRPQGVGCDIYLDDAHTANWRDGTPNGDRDVWTGELLIPENRALHLRWQAGASVSTYQGVAIATMLEELITPDASPTRLVGDIYR